MSTSGTDDTIAPAPSGLDATVAPRPSGLEATVAPAASGGDATFAVGSSPPVASRSSTPGSTRLGVVDYAAYKFDRALSRGGMGKISIVTDQRLRRTVALKEVLADNPQLHTRFLREAEITAQLQHPSVVPIYEAGYWPNREPFYAMKLVEGRPLSGLIEKAATLRERLALLPNLVAISDALSYAHARRIIHRDLKPDNVLVGEYGETVVIDWGLAKRLGTDDDPASSEPAAVEGGDHTTTHAGAVLGTPAFMPPEQARGEVIDERADVYALGAILYNVLTGKVPYADSKSVVELMARLQDEAPRPLLTLVPDAPVDLVAIVEKAMARDPASRYASAKDLADDLRRYTTGQLVGAHSYSLRQLLGRWIRKHRGPLAVAGVAALAIIVLAVVGLQRIRRERNVAEAQRAEARAHRADVESLLDFMLTDLRASLKKTGSLSALAGAVTRTQAYFDTHDPGDAPDDLARSAQAMSSVAQVLAAQGKTDESIAAYEKAAAIAQRGLTRHPGHARLFEVWWLARSLTARGHAEKNGLERAEAIVAELDLAAIPATLEDDTRDLLAASRAFTTTTIAFVRGDLEASLAAGNEELAARKRRSERKPDDSARVVEYVSVYSQLARIALRDWNLPAASEAARRGLDALSAPLARDPADQELRMARATMLERLAAVAQAEGKQAEALSTYQDILRIAEDLHQLDGTNVDYLRHLSLTENKVSTALLNRGDIPAAGEHQQRSTAIAEQLHERDPGNDVWTRDLSIAYDRETSITNQTGKVEDALAFARKSEALRIELLARHPEDPNAYRDLGIARVLISEMLQGLGRMPDAVEILRKAEENFGALVKLEPDTVQHQVDACEVGKKLGYVLAGSGDVDGGLAELQRVWTELEQLLQRPEATDMWRLLLGTTAEAYAEVLLQAKRQDEAAAVLKRGVEVLDKLVAAQPDEVIYAQELTGALALQSMALDRPATATEAAASLARARTLVDALVAKHPDHAGLRNYQRIIAGMKVTSAPAP